MKKSAIFLIIFLPFLSQAQTQTSFGLNIGLGSSYRHLAGSDSNPIALNSREKESAKTSYRIGVEFNQRLSQKIFLRTGLRFAQMGYQYTNSDLRWGSQIQAALAGEEIPEGEGSEVQFIYNYRFLEIPMIGRYEFSDKKWTPFVEVGLSPNIYLKTPLKYRSDDDWRSSDMNEDNLQKLQLVGSLSFGMNFNPTPNSQFFAQPVFHYHLTALYDAPIKERLYSYGLELGMRQKLR